MIKVCERCVQITGVRSHCPGAKTIPQFGHTVQHRAIDKRVKARISEGLRRYGITPAGR